MDERNFKRVLETIGRKRLLAVRGTALIGNNQSIADPGRNLIPDGLSYDLANDPQNFILKRAYFRFRYAEGPAGESGDSAMMGEAKPQTPGGIDLNPAKLDIQDEGQNIQVNVPAMDMKMFEGADFKGLTPFIIQIVPITNLPLLLGTREAVEGEKLSMR